MKTATPFTLARVALAALLLAAAPAWVHAQAEPVQAPETPAAETQATVSSPDEDARAVAEQVKKDLDRVNGRIRADIDLDSDDSFIGQLVPLMAVILSLGFPPIIVGIILFYKYKRTRMRYNAIVTLAEKGMQVPTLDFDEGRKDPMGDLRKGAICLAVGIGMCIFFGVAAEPEALGLGAIPALIGLAYIFIHFMGQKAGNSQATQEDSLR